MEGDSLSLIIIVICVIFSAYFSATETAFSTLNRIRVKNMADKGNRRAALVLKLAEKYDNMLSSILIGNNIVNIASASLATTLFIKLLGEEKGPGISTLVTTIVVLIFGEISPKSIAKESPEKFAMFSAPILKMIMWILTPFNFLFSLWKKLLSKIFKTQEEHSITEEELLTIVEEAQLDGSIDEQEGSLIRSALEFTELTAMEVLTPRIDITGVSTEATKDEVAAVFAESGYSRLPLYEESMDHIVGIIYQKDFHNYVYRTERQITDIVKPVLFITKTKKISELLRELQQKKSHIAIVVDEYGETMGLVTLEDILEELVGDIWDEHDEVTQEIQKLSDKEYFILGSANVEEVFEYLNIQRELDVMTVSGWVMESLGRIPVKDDAFEFEHLHVTVMEMEGKRVKRISVRLPEQTEEEA